jgi:hypothetical protein
MDLLLSSSGVVRSTPPTAAVSLLCLLSVAGMFWRVSRFSQLGNPGPWFRDLIVLSSTVATGVDGGCEVNLR